MHVTTFSFPAAIRQLSRLAWPPFPTSMEDSKDTRDGGNPPNWSVVEVLRDKYLVTESLFPNARQSYSDDKDDFDSFICPALRCVFALQCLFPVRYS